MVFLISSSTSSAWIPSPLPFCLAFNRNLSMLRYIHFGIRFSRRFCRDSEWSWAVLYSGNNLIKTYLPLKSAPILQVERRPRQFEEHACQASKNIRQSPQFISSSFDHSLPLCPSSFFPHPPSICKRFQRRDPLIRIPSCVSHSLSSAIMTPQLPAIPDAQVGASDLGDREYPWNTQKEKP